MDKDDVNSRNDDQIGTPTRHPSAIQSPENSSRDGSPARKFVRSPSGNYICDTIRNMNFQQPSAMAETSGSTSPTRKIPSSNHSIESQKPKKISASGKALNWEQFLTHCSFPTTDLVVRGMIQLNHIPHWSNFLTASVESLTKMGFPLSSANQIMYGTQTLPAEYFEK